jgi:hypothetical protein
MRLISEFALIATMALLPLPALAQGVCNNPKSCAKLHCVKTCVDTWENGVCLGGYCPQGFTPQAAVTGKKDMVIHQASPALQQRIQDLLNSTE